jgi:hypothetical protein
MKIKIQLFILVILLAIIAACSNETEILKSTDNSFEINGDGYEKQKIHFDIFDPENNAIAVYNPRDDMTYIMIVGMKDEKNMLIDIHFKGGDTSIYNMCAYENRSEIVIGDDRYYCVKGKIDVNDYGEEGDYVLGRFSGVFKRDVKSTVSTKVEISFGEFKVKRIKDDLSKHKN